jgi:uncharacterized protein YjbJ (UPF0337 family)
MNKDILAGNWKQVRGQIKNEWGEFTNDELDQISGQFDMLVGKLQEKYGYNRMEAENELNKFLQRVAEKLNA